MRFNFVVIPAYLLFGLVADKVGAKWTLIISICVSAISAPLLWISSASSSGMVAITGFALLWGATSSLLPQLTPMLVHEIVGDRHFSLAMGINVLFFGLAMSVGSIFTGWVFDQGNGYIPAFQALAVLMALAVFPVLAIRSSKSSAVHAE